MGCCSGWVFVSRVCFLGATYELGALYPLYLSRPFGFFIYNVTYKKKKSKKNSGFGN
jgi:hypothetical protein